jgi:hypothetical protein
MSEPMGRRRDRSKPAALSENARSQIQNAIDGVKKWLPDCSGITDDAELQARLAVVDWKRNGATHLPLLAGKPWTREQLLGTNGRLRVAIPKQGLPVNEFGFGYELRKRLGGTEFARITPDPFDVDLPDTDAAASAGSPMGFDPISVGLTAISVIAGIYQLLHPTIDVVLGGQLGLAARMDGDTLTVSFSADAPSIEAKAWFLSATLKVDSVEISPERVRVHFASNWTGVAFKDLAL